VKYRFLEDNNKDKIKGDRKRKRRVEAGGGEEKVDRQGNRRKK